MTDIPLLNLVCGECGSEYQVRRTNRPRGPGAFNCQVCGEQIFLWTSDENTGYDFKLIGVRTWPEEKRPNV